MTSWDNSITARRGSVFFELAFNLNDALRDDNWGRYSLTVERIDRALSRAPTNRPEIIWRTITDGRKFRDASFDPDALTVGELTRWKGYSSSTVRPGAYGGGGSYMFEIAKPKSGGYVRAISHHQDEYEYIIPRDRCFKFMGKKTVPWKAPYGGSTHITVYQFQEVEC